MSRNKHQIQGRGTTKIIQDSDAGRIYSHGQVDQTMHHIINLQSSNAKNEENNEKSIPSHAHNRASISKRPTNQGNQRSPLPPSDKEHITCTCDQIIQNHCKRGSKPFCNCEDNNHSTSNGKQSLLQIDIPQLSHNNGSKDTGSKSNQNDERNKRRSEISQVPNNKLSKPLPTEQRDRRQTNYYDQTQSRASPILTSLPSENIPVLGHATRYRDQSFSKDVDDLEPNDRKDPRKRTSNVSDRELNSESTGGANVFLPRTLFGNFGLINNLIHDNRISPSSSLTSVSQNSSVQSSRHAALQSTEDNLRRQVTMESLTYPQFFSPLKELAALYLTNNFTATMGASPSNNISRHQIQKHSQGIVAPIKSNSTCVEHVPPPHKTKLSISRNADLQSTEDNLRRQVTMERLTYPKFFSPLRELAALCLTNEFTATTSYHILSTPTYTSHLQSQRRRQSSVAPIKSISTSTVQGVTPSNKTTISTSRPQSQNSQDRVHPEPSGVSLHTANSSVAPTKSSSTVQDNRPRRQSTMQNLKYPAFFSTSSSTESNNGRNRYAKYNWVPHAFFLAVVWLLYLTYSALHSSPAAVSGSRVNSTAACQNFTNSGKMYGKYDGQIG